MRSGQHWKTADVTPSPAPASRPRPGVTTDPAGSDSQRRLPLRILLGVVVLILAGSGAALVLDHNTGQIGHESALMGLVAVSLAATILLHGLLLGRPLTVAHGATAAAALLLATFAVVLGHPADAWICLVLSAAMLIRPRGSTAQPGALRAVASLVDRTRGDPLAPFAMAAGKVTCSRPTAPPHSPFGRWPGLRWPAVIRSETRPVTRRSSPHSAACVERRAGASWCWARRTAGDVVARPCRDRHRPAGHPDRT